MFSQSYSKILMLSLGTSGKSTLLKSFNQGCYSKAEEITTALSKIFVSVKNSNSQALVYDMPSLEVSDQMKITDFNGLSTIMICLPLKQRFLKRNLHESLQPEQYIKVCLKWLKNISSPILLVGTMSDIDDEKIETDDARSLSKEEGERLAKKYHLQGYLECSSQNYQGVDEIFKYTLDLAKSYRQRQTEEKEKLFTKVTFQQYTNSNLFFDATGKAIDLSKSINSSKNIQSQNNL